MNRLGFGLLDLPRTPAVHTNGKATAATTLETKSIPTIDPSLFWLSGNPLERIGVDSVRGLFAYQAAALAYICINYRATKIIEAPLIVVEETEDGDTWLKTHPLNPLLERPNNDFGMRRLLRATVVYLDTTGRALWVKNRDRAKRAASMYAFSGDDFSTKSTDALLYGEFEVKTAKGKRKLRPEDVVLFQYFHPTDPHRGLAPLEASQSHLDLAQELKYRLKHMLRNLAQPGGVYNLPKEADPDDVEFEKIKAQLNNGYRDAQSGKLMITTGGGTYQQIASALKELALGELWRENEAMICACFGLPAALVGINVGLENSPWSHLSTAKGNAYDDAIFPLWDELAEPITLQLLREVDDDTSHLIRFDTSRIRALDADQVRRAQVATNNARIWSLNERRQYTGKPRSTDARAEDIPELVAPAAPGAGSTEKPNDGPRSEETTS